MTTLEEGRHASGFILSEANGNRSRENGTLKSGEDLAAGTVVMFDNDKLIAYTAQSVTGGGVEEAAGILLEAVDADDGDTPCAYLARDAEVNQAMLTYPADSTGETEEANTVAALALLGIICR